MALVGLGVVMVAARLLVSRRPSLESRVVPVHPRRADDAGLLVTVRAVEPAVVCAGRAGAPDAWRAGPTASNACSVVAPRCSVDSTGPARR